MDNEELPYRGPVPIGVAKPVSTKDENDYSTLLEVQSDLDDAIAKLYSDFNAFDLKGDPKLQDQVAGRQVAYDILNEVKAKVDTAINDIKIKQEGSV